MTHHRARRQRARRQRARRRRARRRRARFGNTDPPCSNKLTARMIRQLDTKPISSEQLLGAVRRIYADLFSLEGKCIEYDDSQRTAQLNEKQYHALVSLHRSLLHEHHDFMLATQHPSANEGLRRLASKYHMASRMWRHGIHSFLELLRQKLPESLEHMLTFIYIAYTIMTFLSENDPAQEITWFECLGDLARYRMAIEADNVEDRETWTDISRNWYTKVSDKEPTTGRLYHHLAILAQPNALPQLYYYMKALCVPIPFNNAKDNVMTLFKPLLDGTSINLQRLEPIDASFIRVFGILFSGKAQDQLESSMKQFRELLDSRIEREQSNWLQSGYHVGIALSCLLLGFGESSNPLMRAISDPKDDSDSGMVGSEDSLARSQATFDEAIAFAAQTFEIIIERRADENTLPYLHTTLVFYKFMAQYPKAMKHLERHVPWKVLCTLLNYLLSTCESPPRMEGVEFPGPEKNDQPSPLPEDHALRGLIFAKDYFPDGWFGNSQDDDERYWERPSHAATRSERILWISRRIAAHKQWLTWNAQEKQFSSMSEN